MTHWEEDDLELLKSWNDLQRRSPEREWIESLFASPSDSKRESRPRDAIDEYLQGKLNLSRELVRALENEIYVRRRLHDQSIDQIDYQLSCAALSLDHFKTWAVGYNRGIDDKRIEIERTLRDLRKEKRASRVNTWHDLVQLRAQLRERQREYYAALRRVRTSDNW